MELGTIIFISFGAGFVSFVAIGLAAALWYRRRSKVDVEEGTKSLSKPSFPASLQPSGFIPLKDIPPSPIAINPPSYKAPPEPCYSSSRASSMFDGPEGYDSSLNEKPSSLIKPQLTELPISTSIPVPAQLSRQASEPNFRTDHDPYGKGIVHFEGLLESKKWKLKDFKCDSPTYHKPLKSNPWRRSYNVW